MCQSSVLCATAWYYYFDVFRACALWWVVVSGNQMYEGVDAAQKI